MAGWAKKARVAVQMGRIGAHVLGERVRRPRPTVLSEVPVSVRSLTPEWLTAALCKHHPGAWVESVSTGSGSDGSTSRRTLTIRYNDVGRRAGLPERVFTKSTPRFTSRAITLPFGALGLEALFYDRIRPSLSIEAPIGYHMAMDPGSGRSMFLMEDVASSKGATFVDPRGVHIDRLKADDIVSTLAELHGRMWNSPRFEGDLQIVQGARQWQLNVNDLLDFPGRSMIGFNRAESVIPAVLRPRREHIWPAVMRSLDLHRRGPATLLHSDVHSRNWYVTDAGRMGLYDWKCMTRGSWALDVAYAVSSALTVADRRAWERELLELYLDRLAAAGGDKLTFGEAWKAYRQQIFHGLAFWLYTIGAGRLQPAMQPEAVSLVNLERMTNMVVDLDCLAALDE